MRKKRKHSVPSRHEYLEYERRKKELWLKHGPGQEYDKALTELINELGI